jgi:hypothetical protein
VPKVKFFSGRNGTETTIGRKETAALPFQDQQKILRIESLVVVDLLEVEMINTTVTH